MRSLGYVIQCVVAYTVIKSSSNIVTMPSLHNTYLNYFLLLLQAIAVGIRRLVLTAAADFENALSIAKTSLRRRMCGICVMCRPHPTEVLAVTWLADSGACWLADMKFSTGSSSSSLASDSLSRKSTLCIYTEIDAPAPPPPCERVCVECYHLGIWRLAITKIGHLSIRSSIRSLAWKR